MHVVVGTPGRIQDHLRRGTLKLDQIAAVVLDEADEMLRMGFIDDVEEILQHMPLTRQVALFSATMPEAIKRVANRYLKDPVEVKIKTRTTTVATITQRYWQVSGVHKLEALTRILEVEDFDGVILFVRTKNATVELAEKLEARGYSAAPLNGDMNQALREKTVDRLKRGSLDILIATDVAARGLDVERISHVINYDIPHDTESYVHRIGRTGRAGRKGDAILFVAPRERRMLRLIEKATGQPITEMHLPSHEALADKRVMQFKQQISDALESQELGYFEELIDSYQSEHNVGLSEVAAALAYLLQRERPLVSKAGKDKTGYGAGAVPEAKSRETLHAKHKAGRDSTKERPTGKAGVPDEDLVRYRIEVGRNDGVEPKHIVGAIANEAGIDSAYIGHIRIYDDHSTVDLPDGMPREIFQHLRNVWILNRKLNISLLTDKPAHESGKPRKPGTGKPAGKPSFKSAGKKTGKPAGKPAKSRQDKAAQGKRASKR